MFDSELFDVAPYAGFDMEPAVRRTRCSWDDAGWRSLLVQHFTHAPAVDELVLPPTADLHLVLVTGGTATMETRTAGGWRRRRWTPGHLEAMTPHRLTRHRYRDARSLRTVQVHVPGVTLARAAAELVHGATWPSWSRIDEFSVAGGADPEGPQGVGAVRVFRTGRQVSRSGTFTPRIPGTVWFWRLFLTVFMRRMANGLAAYAAGPGPG
jgi:hypothetical protein